MQHVKLKTDKREFVEIKYSFREVYPNQDETSEDGWNATVYEIYTRNGYSYIGKVRVYPNSDIEVDLHDYVDRNLLRPITMSFISQIFRGSVKVPKKACFTKEDALAFRIQKEREENEKLAA